MTAVRDPSRRPELYCDTEVAELIHVPCLVNQCCGAWSQTVTFARSAYIMPENASSLLGMVFISQCSLFIYSPRLSLLGRNMVTGQR